MARARRPILEQRAQRAAALAADRGLCVFQALCAAASAAKLTQPKQSAGPVAFLRWLRQRASDALLQRTVQWQNSPLTSREIEEAVASVARTQIGNGYLCAACDPLLCAFCAVLGANVVHAYQGVPFFYSVDDPRCTVYLRSSTSHMDLERVVIHRHHDAWRLPHNKECTATGPSHPALLSELAIRCAQEVAWEEQWVERNEGKQRSRRSGAMRV